MCISPPVGAFVLASDVLLLGCMESIVHYKRLLLRHHATTLQPQERGELIGNCFELLERLRDVDPQRRNRYSDLGLFCHTLRVGDVTDCRGI